MAGFIKTAPTFDQSNTDEWETQPPLITADDAVSAAGDLAWFDTATGLAARSGSNIPEAMGRVAGAVTRTVGPAFFGKEGTEQFIKDFGYDLSSGVAQLAETGATPLTPEEANKLYPFMDQPFNEPINPYLAKLKADQQIEKQELQYKIQNGPQDMWTKTKQFGVGLLAHMLDPIELGAGYVVGLGIGGAAVKGYLGQAAAQSAKAGGIGAALVEGSGGALIENVAQEGAQKLVENKEGIVDPRSGSEIATDVVIGSLFPAAIQVGVRAPRAIGRIGRMLKNTSPEADLPMVRHTIQAAETGTMPNVEPMIKALAKETDVDPKLVNYEFQPVDIDPATNTASVEGKTFYVATADSAPDAATVPLGDDVGFGTHLTDHPGVADAAGARSMADGIGTVKEVNVDNLKPLNMNDVIPEDLLRDIENHIDFTLSEGRTVKEVLQMVRDGVDAGDIPDFALDRVKRSIQRAGYDSLISDGKTHMGVDHTPHNHIILLDDFRYKYEPMDVSKSVEGKTMYHGTSGTMNKLSEADPISMSSTKNLYGEGLYLTDNIDVAKGYSKTKGGDFKGKVLAAKLKDVKLLDLDKAGGQDLANAVNAILTPISGEKVSPQMKGREMYRIMQEALMDADTPTSDISDIYGSITDSLSSKGIGGFKHEGGNIVGTKPHNVVILFDQKFVDAEGKLGGLALKDKIEDVPFAEKVKEVSTRDANPEMARKPTEAELAEAQKAALEPKRLFQDDKAAEEFDMIEKEQLPETLAYDTRKQVEDSLLEVEDLAKQGYVSTADLDAIKEMAQKGEDKFNFLKAFKNCLMGE